MSIKKFAPSYEIIKERLGKLRAVTPEAFEDGKIDFDILKESFGEFLESETEETEHYAFTWPGKKQARRLAAKPPQGTLAPAKGEGINEGKTENIFIEGDNLEVLKLLQKSYAEKVQLVYIDPPYNTGDDRIYSDNYSQPMDEYLRITGQIDEAGESLVAEKSVTGRFHSKWLSMVYPRLRSARNLLAPEGVIIVHIDENEAERLLFIMEEIFGPENNLGTIVWDKKNPKGDAQGVAYQHETLLVFAKDIGELLAKRPLLRKKYNAEKIIAKAKEIFALKDKTELPPDILDVANKYKLTKKLFSGKELVYDLDVINQLFADWVKNEDGLSGGEAAYNKIDVNGDVWRPVSMAWPNKQQAPDDYFKPLIHPVTGKPCPVPERGWRNPPKTMEKLLKDNRIVFGVDESTQPNRKYLLKENMSENIPSILRFGSSDDVLFKALKVPLYDNPKPYKFSAQLIKYFSRDGDIVLDFFAGSGTVGHALWAQSISDKLKRKFILVQIPEVLKKDVKEQKEAYNFCEKNKLETNVCEIGKERLRRVAKLLKEDFSAEDLKDVDLGFKVYKLRKSHFKEWNEYKGNSIKEVMELFSNQENALVDNWKDEDLLTEVILQSGFPLTSLKEKLSGIPGNNVLKISSDFRGHALYVCLDKSIKTKSIEALPLSGKDRFICLDNAVSDEDKVRLADKGLIETL